MRKILFSIFAGGLIFIGCSKDGGSSGASIVGTWNINTVILKQYVNNELQETDTTTKGSLEFDSNGKTVSTDETGDTTSGTYTYNASNGALVVISDGDTTNATVTKLTNSNLHFTADQSEDFGGFTYRLVLDADLTKQQ